MPPSATVGGALYAKLTADTTLMAQVSGVYRNVAPPSATYPLVIITRDRPSGDQYTLTQHVSERGAWQIAVIDEGYSVAAAEAAQARIYAVLNDSTLSVSGKTTWVMRRMGQNDLPLMMGEPGVLYQGVVSEWMIEMA